METGDGLLSVENNKLGQNMEHVKESIGHISL